MPPPVEIGIELTRDNAPTLPERVADWHTLGLTSQGGARPKGVRRMDVRGRGYEGDAVPLLRKGGPGENQTRHK